MLSLTASVLAAAGASSIQGWMTSEGVTGDPSAGRHRWDREIVYLSPVGATEGDTVGMRMLASEPGWFLLEQGGGFPAGSYALFSINQGNIDGGTVGFDYRAGWVEVPEGTSPLEGLQFQTHAHYVAMYSRHYTDWAAAPWLWGSNFHQTFIATSPAVIRLATKLAGKDAGPGTHHLSMTLNFALYRVGVGPPRTWERVSPIRQRFLPGTMDPIIHILDVNYLSRETPLVAGQTYAVRLWVQEGSQATRFAVVARPKNGRGYPGGHAYVDETARDWDLYGCVSGTPPGTVVSFGPVDQDRPMNANDLLGSKPRHGQTFQATGSGLAAVELLYTVGCNPNPSKRIVITLRDGVHGQQIGPAKTCRTVTDVCQGRAAVFWEKGRAPLVPGRTYYLEFDSALGGGINVWSMNGDMPEAEAHVDGVSVGPKDLALTIVEFN